MWLEFGDRVEIPIREHALNEEKVGLTKAQASAIDACISKLVELHVKGVVKKFYAGSKSGWSYLGPTLTGPESQGLLFTSSDLSKVKVTRRDPKAGTVTEFNVNVASKPTDAEDLWLRDGDVIEVPERIPSIFDTDPAKARDGGTVYLTGAAKNTSLEIEKGKTMTVLMAVVRVGTTDFANLKKVELQRVDPQTKRAVKIVLDVDAMAQGDRSQEVLLQDGDLIRVPTRLVNW